MSIENECVLATERAHDGASPAILVVDDDEEVRIIVAEFLEDFGYSVVQAGGGRAALKILESTPSIRLLISDIRMPDMSGIELTDRATAQWDALKVILISGYFVAQQVTRRFLRKPFRMIDLESAVRAELGPPH
ncbi:MAG: response regulator [Rhodospirillales bacterium]|nr:response regulator [Rhodospirillales bacterium]MBN8902931.1 response regulator [Rhodospirillales bacterium]